MKEKLGEEASREKMSFLHLGWQDGKNVIIGRQDGKIVEYHAGEVVDSDPTSMRVNLVKIKKSLEEGAADPTKDRAFSKSNLSLWNSSGKNSDRNRLQSFATTLQWRLRLWLAFWGTSIY